jgi:hypothetical protein
MRRLIAPAALVVLLTLAGCGGAPTPISEQEFLQRANALPSFESLTGSALAELGQSVCNSFKGRDAGERKTVALAFAAAGEKDGESGPEALAFVDLAVARYCPDLPAK